MRVTVLGAGGATGLAVVHELASRGHEVTATSRSITADAVAAGVRAVPTDLRDLNATTAVCRGAEVVVMAANVPYRHWATDLLPLFDASVSAATTAGAHLVVADNLYAYGAPDGPITDASPESATTRKGQLRHKLARRLLDAHHAGRLPVTIGRFSDHYGPYGENSLVVQLGVRRVLAGKAPQAFIDADQPHTFAYLPDTAHGFATLVERPDAAGRSWILPAAEPITQRELYRHLSDAAGVPPRLGRVSRPMLLFAGMFDANLREAREVTASFARPYVVRADDFAATFGEPPLTPHREAIAETLAARRSDEQR